MRSNNKKERNTSFQDGRGNGGRSPGPGRYRPMNHRNHSNSRSQHRGHKNRPFQHGRTNQVHITEFDIQQDLATIEEMGEIDVNSIRIAVQGCAHGNVDRIYQTLEEYENKFGGKNGSIDLLVCCGDFQSLRNEADYQTLAVPPKYKEMGSFYQYYAGMKKAPVLTLFIGGNHEASGSLQELYYGGWVAPNMYYMGAAGVVRFRGLRIAGLSGIFHANDYSRGRYEEPPYDNWSLRSVYHYRNVEVARLKCLSSNQLPSKSVVDIMLTHDWPRGIERFGNTDALLRKKKYFTEEVRQNNLGSPLTEELLYLLKPQWWFAAHLHVKFYAQVVHSNESQDDNFVIDTKPEPSVGPSFKSHHDNRVVTTNFVGIETSNMETCQDTPDLTALMTRFLSLDKCLPRRQHLQIMNIPRPTAIDSDSDDLDSGTLHYDIEWLAILRKTHQWTIKSNARQKEPDYAAVQISDQDRYDIINRLRSHRQTDTVDNLPYSRLTEIPNNFSITVLPHGSSGSEYPLNNGRMIGNPQTDVFLDFLGLNHIVTVPYMDRSEMNSAEFLSDGKKLMNADDTLKIYDDDCRSSDVNEIDIDNDIL